MAFCCKQIPLTGDTGMQLSVQISHGMNKGKLFKCWQKHEAAWAGQAYGALANTDETMTCLLCDLSMPTLTQHAIYIKMSLCSSKWCVFHKSAPNKPQRSMENRFHRQEHSEFVLQKWQESPCPFKIQIQVGQFSKQRHFIHGAAANYLH